MGEMINGWEQKAGVMFNPPGQTHVFCWPAGLQAFSGLVMDVSRPTQSSFIHSDDQYATTQVAARSRETTAHGHDPKPSA